MSLFRSLCPAGFVRASHCVTVTCDTCDMYIIHLWNDYKFGDCIYAYVFYFFKMLILVFHKNFNWSLRLALKF